MATLADTRVLFLMTDGFEDSELSSPWLALSNEGARLDLASPAGETVTGKNGYIQDSDFRSDAVTVTDFDALVLPGGLKNSDDIRLDEASVALVREFFVSNKPVGVMCHGAWILTDADVLGGRTITSYPSLKTDLENAGATWVDEEVVIDDGLISSRTPEDLASFNAALISALAVLNENA